MVLERKDEVEPEGVTVMRGVVNGTILSTLFWGAVVVAAIFWELNTM